MPLAAISANPALERYSFTFSSIGIGCNITVFVLVNYCLAFFVIGRNTVLQKFASGEVLPLLLSLKSTKEIDITDLCSIAREYSGAGIATE